MRLENDTSHDGWSDFSARNRTPSVMQLLSKKAKMAFFDSLKTALCFAKSSFSVSKKPRRVRARRREDIEIRFLRRHKVNCPKGAREGPLGDVRRRKHFSPRKRANGPYFTDRSCAAAGCIPFVKKGFTFFDSLKCRERTKPLPALFF